LAIQSWPKEWLVLVEYAPYAVTLIGGFVSVWLNRIQPFLILLSVLVLNVMFWYFAPAQEVSISLSILFPIVSLLLPLNLLLWIYLPEKGVHNQLYNLSIAVLFLIQAGCVYWFMTELPLQWIEWISISIAPNLTFYHLPFASSLAFVMVGFLLSIKLGMSKQLRIFNHAMVFILLLMAFALNQYQHTGTLAWVSSIVGLIIILTLVFDSHHIAYTDELTGLKGRRALNESFMGLGKRYAIAMIDIDHFKQFNDRYGHDVGDTVLKMVASVLETVSGGKVYRFGGEEFTIVFAGKTVEMVEGELERLRVDVANQAIYLNDEKANKTSKKAKAKPVNVTISLGLAEPDKTHTTAEQVLKFADEGLYKAKAAGRNKLIRVGAKPAKSSKPKKTAKSS
jgi:diguanylate cyclase (GGDEF)-like protein